MHNEIIRTKLQTQLKNKYQFHMLQFVLDILSNYSSPQRVADAMMI